MLTYAITLWQPLESDGWRWTVNVKRDGVLVADMQMPHWATDFARRDIAMADANDLLKTMGVVK